MGNILQITYIHICSPLPLYCLSGEMSQLVIKVSWNPNWTVTKKVSGARYYYLMEKPKNRVKPSRAEPSQVGTSEKGLEVWVLTLQNKGDLQQGLVILLAICHFFALEVPLFHWRFFKKAWIYFHFSLWLTLLIS